VRGYRIELGEIEAVLCKHPGVKQAAVVAREETGGDRRLVAYLVTDDGQPAGDLKEFLRRKLPEYMAPAQYITLPELPLNGSGKVDRKRLPEPPVETNAIVQASWTETERKVAAIWAELLRAELPDIHANFFDLGGHSLLAAQLVSRVRDLCEVELPVVAVFTAPTIAGLAAAIEQANAAHAGEAAAPILALPRAGERREQLLAQLSASQPQAILHNQTLAEGGDGHE
jgi:acyl carrier protein